MSTIANIRVGFIREKDGMLFTNPDQHQTPEKALHALLFYEVGFGCVITDITEASVTVKTNIMGCVDTTTVSGTAQDMEPIVKAMAYVVHCQLENNPIDSPKFMEDLMVMTKGLPLFLNLMSPMLIGANILKMVVIALFGTEDEGIVKQLVKHSSEDLYTAYAMKAFHGATLDQSLELLEVN